MGTIESVYDSLWQYQGVNLETLSESSRSAATATDELTEAPGLSAATTSAETTADDYAAYRNPYEGPTLNLDDFIVHAEFPPPIHRIFGEIRQLHVEDVPNATFDILRTFVEKTIKSFADLQGSPVQSDRHYVQFGHCLTWLESYCGQHDSLKQFKGSISKVRTSRNNFSITADAYNAANHDRNISYGPAEVREAWNSVHGVMKAMLHFGPDAPR